jgi:hypothetical protein
MHYVLCDKLLGSQSWSTCVKGLMRVQMRTSGKCRGGKSLILREFDILPADQSPMLCLPLSFCTIEISYCEIN